MANHRYLPHTQADIDAMLARCDAKTLNDLFADIPAELRMRKPYNLPAEYSEIALRRFFDALNRQNTPLTCFAGAGYYDRYTPSVIPSLMARSEFLTAYTPYQPEISQGTLQYIFEYQSMMCSLTGMDVSNASMYDGATATAEAMMMCVAATRKKDTVLVSATLNPAVRAVVDTYARYHGVKIETIAATADGTTSRTDMQRLLANGNVAGVIVATPNYYGILEDLDGFADDIHAAKALLVVNSPAVTLGVIKPAAEWGADIAVGEAQSLGMPLNYGGPYLGYICTRNALIRKLPGRIVGATTDEKGQRVFVLTLQAREQHIRREKATSNICSNQGIMTLFAAMYLSVMGAEGLRRVNAISCDGAHYLAQQLQDAGVAELMYPASPFLNEFAVRLKGISADDVLLTAEAQGFLAGVKLADDALLMAVTEMRTRDEIDRLVEILTLLKPNENE